MLRRLHALYLRYASVHAVRLTSVPIGPPGRRFGQVEQVAQHGGAIVITGWVDATTLRVSWRGGEVSMIPDLPRADVAAKRRLPLDCGFEVSVPAEARDLRLWVDRAGSALLPIPLPHPSDRPTPAAHRRLRRAFARDLIQSIPDLARYALTPNERTKTAMKRALRLDVARRGQVLDTAWFLQPAPAPAHAAPHSPAPVTIILPVHNALALVQACLARVAAHTDLPWHLVIVEDASTDPALRPWLVDWAAGHADRVSLILLDDNLGFVGAVNEGLRTAEALAENGPVILLNSDAMVPAGWASRLTDALADPTVASVTPLSNAAEILSVPAIGPGIPLQPGQGDALDRVAQTFAPVADAVIPTGVGFCMALSRAWLARVPRLDPAFGRGYGEEVDWCAKTAASGARHVAQPRLFVEHVGGQSFGAAHKADQIRRGNALISRRYPGHDAAVQAYIAADPLAAPRLSLATALAGLCASPLPVFLAHSLGGGAEVALDADIAALPAAVVLRVGGRVRWQVEVHVAGQIMAGQTDDLHILRRMLAPVAALRLIYSCGVGDPDPLLLPKALLSLRRDGAPDTVEMRIHDYFPLSPSYTLLTTRGFEGAPISRPDDPAHIARRPDGSPVPWPRWQAEWGKLVAASREVTVFSRTALDLVREVYPDAPLRQHVPALPAPVRAVRPGHADCIGILGNMNHQKGALVLRQIATQHPALRFIILGHADSAISLPRNVTIHGTYRPQEIADLTESYGIGAWLMPAIWPETFSFATREALATGLPVAGFALGAQGEALDAAANGITVPLMPPETMAPRLFAALKAAQDAGPTMARQA